MRHPLQFAASLAPRSLAWLLLLACCGVGVQPAAANGHRCALLIGVNKYSPASGLRNLNFCENDVEGLARVLIAGGFDAGDVVVMTTSRGVDRPQFLPTRSNILKQLDILLARMEKEDSLIVALAGHGVMREIALRPGANPVPRSFFCPPDCLLSDMNTLVDLDEVYRQLEESPAGFKLLLSDACRNDAFLPNAPRASVRGISPMVPPRGIAALYSCAANQFAWEDHKLDGGHGVFFHFVIQGLQGAADLDRDGQLAPEELSLYTKREVGRHVGLHMAEVQTPQFLGNLTGSLPIVPRPVEPPLLVAPFTASAARSAQEGWARALGKPRVEEANSLGMTMVLIPPGEFTIGSPGYEEGRRNDEPQHTVRITRPYDLGAHEVTKGQFAQFVADTGYATQAERDGEGGWGWNGSTQLIEGREPQYTWRSWGVNQSDSSPVVNVTWNDAVAFCQWLSRKEGKTYQLPTEAQWEYACRGGTTSRYYNGNDAEGLAQVGNVFDATARSMLSKNYSDWGFISARDGFAFTAPVGPFRANSFGLYDLHGNVWEWCADWYDRGYYGKSPVDDPLGADSGMYRVLRGGGWSSTPRYARSAHRSGHTPDYRYLDLGFRVARVPVAGR